MPAPDSRAPPGAWSHPASFRSDPARSAALAPRSARPWSSTALRPARDWVAASLPRCRSGCCPHARSRPGLATTGAPLPPGSAAESRPCAPGPAGNSTIPSRQLGLWARMKTRSRRWLAPTPAALNTSHSALNPSAAKSPRTSPSPLEKSPGTFSTKTTPGPTSRTTRATSGHNHRSSADPRREPATLTGWHGKPAETR